MANTRKVVTPIFRVSYAHLWTPSKSESGSDVWSVTGIFDEDADLDELNAIIEEAKKAKWPKGAGKLKMPIRYGDTEEFDLAKNPEYEGKYIVPMRSYNRAVHPVDRNKKPIQDKDRFYSGCYAIASVVAYDFNSNGNKGVAFGLQSIMKVRDGEPLVAYSNPEQDFAEVDVSQYGEEVDNSALFDALGDL